MRSCYWLTVPEPPIVLALSSDRGAEGFVRALYNCCHSWNVTRHYQCMKHIILVFNVRGGFIKQSGLSKRTKPVRLKRLKPV